VSGISGYEVRHLLELMGRIATALEKQNDVLEHQNEILNDLQQTLSEMN
jgi:hypothetical protein